MRSPDTDDLHGITCPLAEPHGILFSRTGCPVGILPGDFGDGKFRDGQVSERLWLHAPVAEREPAYMRKIM